MYWLTPFALMSSLPFPFFYFSWVYIITLLSLFSSVCFFFPDHLSLAWCYCVSLLLLQFSSHQNVVLYCWPLACTSGWIKVKIKCICSKLIIFFDWIRLLLDWVWLKWTVGSGFELDPFTWSEWNTEESFLWICGGKITKFTRLILK